MTSGPGNANRSSGLAVSTAFGAAFGLLLGLMFGDTGLAVAFAVLGGAVIGLDIGIANRSAPA
jgi:hypothetical protein